MSKPLRVAVVGCGRIAQTHFAAMEHHSADLTLVAVCDTADEVLQKHVERLRVAGYSQLEDLLKKEKLDLVVLCTPSGYHADQAILGAGYGVNVVTEKPLATKWSDGLRMVRACEEAAVRLFVIKQNRYNKTLQLLKKAISQGRFGKIYSVSVNVFWTRPQAYYDAAKWRGTWALDGGAFMNQASHYIDLLSWLFGSVESVMAYTATLGRDIEAEDTGVAAIRWHDGTLGTLNVTMLTYPKNLEGSITVLGETGTVRIGGIAVNEIQNWDFLESVDESEDISLASYETTSVYGHGHVTYYENLIKALREEGVDVSDGNDGLECLELLIALYRSAQQGTRVSLPLSTKETD
jgi:UDP-N-acetyl-2-amino-2-deoxyglucuronate dehydrogenase